MLRMMILTIAALGCWGGAQSALAHGQSSSHLELTLQEGKPHRLTLEMSMIDLAHLLDIDANADGQLTWGEISDSSQRVVDAIVSGISIHGDTTACALSAAPTTLSLANREEAPALLVALQVQCPQPEGPGELFLGYQLFFDGDPTHKAMLNVTGAGVQMSKVLTRERREVRVPG